MIFKEEDDDGREGNRRRRTSYNKRRVNRDQISEIARLSSSKNFICKRKNLILDKQIDFEPV